MNAAGSNSPRRRELDDKVFERAAVVVTDSLEQARGESGDLIFAVESGVLAWSSVHELSDVISSKAKGRESDGDITVFESQGMALEDVAAARYVYDAAREAGAGENIAFGGTW